MGFWEGVMVGIAAVVMLIAVLPVIGFMAYFGFFSWRNWFPSKSLKEFERKHGIK